ncbi:hypothetical protein ACS0TY_000879 [Phlomoides rotata]
MNFPHLSKPLSYLLLAVLLLFSQSSLTASRNLHLKLHQQLNYEDGDDSPTYIWPLPWQYTSGNQTLTVDPNLYLSTTGNGGNSSIVSEAFERYKRIIFEHTRFNLPSARVDYDLTKLNILIHSDNEELQLGVDESHTLYVGTSDEHSVIYVINIEANTVYGVLRALETLSQLCDFHYGTKTVRLYNAPWFIQDNPRFKYRGLLLDTSRHFMPIEIIKQVIESMSYAKLNVLHWHIIDEESFPLEVPSYPKLWKGAYTKRERYTTDDAAEIVNFAKMRGINVMAEIDVPGHAEAWGVGYPDLWPSPSCPEPLDVSNNFTFDVISGILSDIRKIFPFELFHLGGDEVKTDCWISTPHVNQWLQDHNMTGNDAYKYFVQRAQEIAMSLNWTPVSWEETFYFVPESLNSMTVVQYWLREWVTCQAVVAKGFRCIYSNQYVWYLDHLDVPWNKVYDLEPLADIADASEQQLVLGGEVCMWTAFTDASNVQQTIWPRAAAAAERLWSPRESGSSSDTAVLSRLEYFRCLLTRRGVPAAPVQNLPLQPPNGAGSCYMQ